MKKTPLKRSGALKKTPFEHKISQGALERLERRKLYSTKQRLLFEAIWKERKHYSEISRDNLGNVAYSFLFHHILPKSKYPDLALLPENIILLTLEEHETVESNPTRYEEINRRREQLLKEHGKTR